MFLKTEYFYILKTNIQIENKNRLERMLSVSLAAHGPLLRSEDLRRAFATSIQEMAANITFKPSFIHERNAKEDREKDHTHTHTRNRELFLHRLKIFSPSTKWIKMIFLQRNCGSWSSSPWLLERKNTVSFVTTLTDGTLPHISGTCPRVTPCQVYLHSAVNWYNNGSLEYTPKKSDCTVLS